MQLTGFKKERSNKVYLVNSYIYFGKVPMVVLETSKVKVKYEQGEGCALAVKTRMSHLRG